jgi:hypothetical protein
VPEHDLGPRVLGAGSDEEVERLWRWARVSESVRLHRGLGRSRPRGAGLPAPPEPVQSRTWPRRPPGETRWRPGRRFYSAETVDEPPRRSPASTGGGRTRPTTARPRRPRGCCDLSSTSQRTLTIPDVADRTVERRPAVDVGERAIEFLEAACQGSLGGGTRRGRSDGRPCMVLYRRGRFRTPTDYSRRAVHRLGVLQSRRCFRSFRASGRGC